MSTPAKIYVAAAEAWVQAHPRAALVGLACMAAVTAVSLIACAF